MGLTVSGKGKDFVPPPEGTYTAVCVQVIDLGTQYSEFYGKSTKKVLIGWELMGMRNEHDEPWLVHRRFTASLGTKAALRIALRAWRGREFTDAEIDAFNLRNIVGAPCMLNITHRKDGDSTYADISGVMALPAGMPKPTPTLPKIVFDIENWDDAVFKTFSDNLKKTIMSSDERKGGQRQDIGVTDSQLSSTGDDVPF